MAATEGAEKAPVADLMPSTQLGTACGWFNLTTGLMLLPASLLFGWLWQSAGPTVAFGFGAGCAPTAAALLVRWVPTPEHHPARRSSTDRPEPRPCQHWPRFCIAMIVGPCVA